MDFPNPIQINRRTYLPLEEIVLIDATEDENPDEWRWYAFEDQETNEVIFVDDTTDDNIVYLLQHAHEQLDKHSAHWKQTEFHQTVEVRGNLPGVYDGEVTEVCYGVVEDELFATETSKLFQRTGRLAWFDELPYYRCAAIAHDEQTYFSENFPAAQLPRKEQPRTRIPTHFHIVNYLIVLAFFGLGLLELYPINEYEPDFVTAFWIVGLCAGIVRIFPRSFTFQLSGYLLFSTFSLFVSTKFLQNWLGATWGQSIRNWHILGCAAVIIVLYLVAKKLFAMLAHAASAAMITILVLYTIGLLLVSLFDEYWWGRHFDYYLGASPYGYIGFAIFLLWLWVYWKDYLHVPMNQAAFHAQNKQLREALHQPIREIQKRSKKLSVIADDLGDAVNISGDPAIASLYTYLEPLQATGKGLANLDAHIFSEEKDKEQLHNDFLVLIEDLKDVDDMIRSPGSETIPNLRVSPQLLILSHNTELSALRQFRHQNSVP